MKHTIHVTAEDIKNGKPFECEQCPVALAIKRQLEEYDVVVDGIEICIRHDYVPTPDPVNVFIGLFDNAKSRHLAEPFWFDLEIPENTI